MMSRERAGYDDVQSVEGALMSAKRATPDEHQALRALVQSVVLAQGNIFIRELLRQKNLRIGVKKEDFEAHLLDAIDSGGLQLADVQAWLEEVEGWGDQHVYLFDVARNVAEDPIWKSVARLRRKLPEDQKELWRTQSYKFPGEWGLTGISFEDETLSYIWHRHRAHLIRKKAMDRREEIEGDWYQFRAHLERLDRAAMRFVLRLDRRIAAVFMQIPLEGKSHEQALNRVREATKPLVDWTRLNPFPVSDGIKRLDQTALDAGDRSKIIPHRTRLADAGNYVEFGSTSEAGDFRASAAVRSVRRAVKLGQFAGQGSVFAYKTSTSTGLPREVKVELFGEARRVRLWAQLKAHEVWEVIELLMPGAKA